MVASQPAIDFFGLKVLEPVTTLTDLIVSAACFYAFIKLKRSANKESAFIYFQYFFLTMGLATTIGGLIGHAFIYAFNFSWKIPGWIISMFSVALIERFVILHARPLMGPSIGKFFGLLNLIELTTFIFITIYTLNFYFVEVHAAYGLLVIVFSFELFVFLKTKNKGSKMILYGVGLAAVSAMIHICKFSIHQWFNYFDLSHIFMTISVWFFYKGAQEIFPEKNGSKMNI